MEANLLQLDDDLNNIERLHTFFRACHTIKGLAGFLRFDDIQELAHVVETLVDELREGKFEVKHCHVDVLFTAVDLFKDLFEVVRASLEGVTLVRPTNFAKVLKCLVNVNRSDCDFKVDPTKKLGEVLVDAGIIHPKRVETAIVKQVRGDKRKVGEILVEESVITPQTVEKVLHAQKEGRSKRSSEIIEESVRVPVRRLDHLIDSIGEAVIAQSMIAADPLINDENFEASGADRELLRLKVARAEVIMRQIQELSMSLRMVSIRSVFQKMGRLVRDLSRETGKKVDLILEGENTELDKTVIENIGDPLVHMVRNALDHGLETVEERLANNKPEQGTLKLHAFHCAGNVHIEIKDDGRGLDKAQILNKAIERGIVDGKQSLSDTEIYNLIFAPGFSTAAEVTNISGRGVGMDVVRKNIEELRGSVEISSELGRGTTFTIALPLTLAIIDGMVVSLDSERYIVPTLSIVTTVALESGMISTVAGKGEVITLRGELVRLVRLEHLFNEATTWQNSKNGVVVVLSDSTGKKVGLLVDEILEQQQVVIKNMGGSIVEVPGISGGAIMNDGTVSLIIDVAMLLRQI
ncbi:MAG: chemotaxis protein CheA [Fibrobacter sp.]|nr:chemotaxis protein CheA [Fibrobacter sp.]